jgi:DedD protein
VSPAREPSYYEIALTQRQLVVAFVTVLGLLLTAFLLGVWLGRSDGAPVAGAATQEARAGEPSGPEPLRFFSEEGEGDLEGLPAEAEGSPAPEAVPGDDGASSTLAEDLDRGRLPAVSAEPEPGGAAPPETSTEPEGRPADPPATAAPPAPPPETLSQPVPTRATRAPGQGGVVVQVFSSRDQAQAQRVLERLLAADQDAFLSPVEVGGQVMYRVRIGPFDDRDQARQVADRVRHQFKLDTWITQ